MADIMRFFDGAIAFLPCVTHKYYERCEECRDEETCGIRDVFLEVRNSTVQILKNATLSEIIRIEKRLDFLKES
jgi:DNA-binding IscR family transcriptional regulator